MADIRQAIAQGSFESFRAHIREGWAQGDIAPR
jgi:queuine/archaeosine tRNA-ribosyltransferase